MSRGLRESLYCLVCYSCVSTKHMYLFPQSCAELQSAFSEPDVTWIAEI